MVTQPKNILLKILSPKTGFLCRITRGKNPCCYSLTTESDFFFHKVDQHFVGTLTESVFSNRLIQNSHDITRLYRARQKGVGQVV